MAVHHSRWPNEINSRLHGHPQARMIPVVRKVWGFDCPNCGRTCYLRDAAPQPDGSLWCSWCSPLNERQAWCPSCQQTKPESEFNPLADPSAEGLAAALGLERSQMGVCHECYLTPKVPPTCEQCGEEFKHKRKDARFCSGACRVAAHRARQR